MKIPQIRIPIVCGIILLFGGFSIGLTLSYSSPTIDALTAKFNFSSFEKNCFICISSFVGFIAAIVAAVVIKYTGKKLINIISGFIGGMTFLILGFANAKWLVFFARALNGATLGLYSAGCPSFLAEIAPEGKSGFYGFLNQCGICFGFLFATVFGLFDDYQLCSYLCSIPSFIIMIGIIFVPEKKQVGGKSSKFTKLFKYKSELLIAMITLFFLQFSGINAILGNLQSIIEKTNIKIKSKYVALIANAVQIVATIIATFLIDFFGYTVCWVFSTIGQMIAFLLLFFHQEYDLPSGVFMLGLFLEQFTYGVGTGPIPFAFAAEIMKPSIRAAGCSLSIAVSWFFAGLVCIVWPTLQSAMKNYSYIFFGVISLLAAIFGFFKVRKVNVDDSSSSSDQMSRRLSKRGDEAL